jgi:hypothetical protein
LANNSDELGFKNKAHGSDDFTYTQSGIYEKNILCAECDNKLGVLENTAAKALRAIRKAAKLSSIGDMYWKALRGTASYAFDWRAVEIQCRITRKWKN